MDYISLIFAETYKILFLIVPVLVSVAMIVWLDRRVWAFVQKRQGPNVVGPFGLLQSLADALKYIFKEIIIPASSNKIIFTIGDIVFISKLIDGSFPDYKRVIPKDNNNILKIDRYKLLSAVDRVSTVVNEKSPVIKFKLLTFL